jgi:hypothetical protein
VQLTEGSGGGPADARPAIGQCFQQACFAFSETERSQGFNGGQGDLLGFVQ